MHNPVDWDALRVVLAVGRDGSLAAAARRLGINHATVLRRLGRIEQRLGVRLFERRREGCTPTPAGEEAVALAGRLEAGIGALERRLAGRDLRPAGSVRLATTDTLLAGPVAPALAAFRRKNPEIDLEVVVADEHPGLTRRDADVAVRPATDPGDRLAGRRICGIAAALYGPRRGQDGASPGRRALVAPDDSLAHLPLARWIQTKFPNARIACRTNTLLGMRDAARAGMGIAALPCFLGDVEPALDRLTPPIPELGSALWLLTHRDLRHIARIRAVLDHTAMALGAQTDLFEGRSAAGAVVSPEI